jgi:hypothetical protein
MISEARTFGLRTAPFKRDLDPKDLVEVQESLTGFWHILEGMPFKRLTFELGHPNRATYR